MYLKNKQSKINTDSNRINSSQFLSNWIMFSNIFNIVDILLFCSVLSFSLTIDIYKFPRHKENEIYFNKTFIESFRKTRRISPRIYFLWNFWLFIEKQLNQKMWIEKFVKEVLFIVFLHFSFFFFCFPHFPYKNILFHAW